MPAMPAMIMADDSDSDSRIVGMILIGLLSSLISGIVLAFGLTTLYYMRVRAMQSGRGWLDFATRPGQFDDSEAFSRMEEEALDRMDEMERAEYLRAKSYIAVHPPESINTEITLSQFLAIQEKGISAWEFEPEPEVASCFVEQRTEIEFYDSECTVMSNLPVPKQNEVYYWEVKIFEKPADTMIAIGMATKPYPLFRMPGFHRTSLAYFSDGSRRYNQPFWSTPYGPQFVQGDVIGVGYRPRSGSIFFTRNGKRLDDVVHGLKQPNFFPTIGAIGPCTVHVNLGQSGYVYIEANVKKWGLAPVTGSLAPPPPYGEESGTLLLNPTKDGYTSAPTHASRHGHSNSFTYRLGNPGAGSASSNPSHGRSRSGTYTRILSPTSPGPIRSPTDISLAQLVPTDETGESSQQAGVNSEESIGLGLQDALNPPPDYTSPAASISSRRNSVDEESSRRGSFQVNNRSRVDSNASMRWVAPIPSYSDAVAQAPRRDAYVDADVIPEEESSNSGSWQQDGDESGQGEFTEFTSSVGQ